MKLEFEYKFTNIFDHSLDIYVKVTGETREALFEKLVKEGNIVALYYFLKKFPELSKEMEMKIEKKILEIGKISSLKKIEFPKHEYLLTYNSILIISGNLKRVQFF